MRTKLIEDAFVDAPTCDSVAAIIDSYGVEPVAQQFDECAVHLDAGCISSTNIELAEVVLIENLRRRVWSRVRQHYDLTDDFQPQATLFKRCYQGYERVAHRDNWPTHPFREFTSLVYLNDCDSGAVKLWNDDDEPCSVLPERGRLVAFDASYWHSVDPFSGNSRYNCMTWYARKDALNLQGEPAVFEGDWGLSWLLHHDQRLLGLRSHLSLSIDNESLMLESQGRLVHRIRILPRHVPIVERLQSMSQFSLASLCEHALDSRGACMELLLAIAPFTASPPST